MNAMIRPLDPPKAQPITRMIDGQQTEERCGFKSVM